MIDELYAVSVADKIYDIIDFEDGNHAVIDGRGIYRQWLEKCSDDCLCEQRYVCSCGSEDEPSGECLHIKAIHRYYREVGDD